MEIAAIAHRFRRNRTGFCRFQRGNRRIAQRNRRNTMNFNRNRKSQQPSSHHHFAISAQCFCRFRTTFSPQISLATA